MPPPKEYQVMRKGRLQTVSKSQYYRLKAQDGGANTRTPELQALLVSRVQTDAPIALSSTSAELTRERTRSIQSGDVDMNLDENATEDEQGNYADDFPDPFTGDEGHSTPPPDPDPPVGDEGHSTPPPDPDPPVGDEDHSTPPPDPPAGNEGHPVPRPDPTPPPDPPAGDEDRRTIQDVDLDEIQRLASIDDSLSPLDPDALDRLRNPPQHQLKIEDPHLRLAIDTYLALEHSAVEAYNNVRKAVLRCYPDTDFPSHHKIKRIVAQMSGIESIVDDMCAEGCTAFTGDYALLDRCPHCHSYRYDQIKYEASNGKVKSPVKVFHTVPIGPQLQTLYRDPAAAANMCYRDERTKRIFEELELADGKLSVYDD
ncbi:hypothetical protein EV424DRAFT_1480170, partial [Suillus variegatus]